ncbi:MAG: Asp-tRNA(Asn)/Glu-tRNA(Gln) amidotransferase subunit GatA, partial [Clostridia bacterium]
MSEITSLTVKELTKALSDGELTSEEITKSYLTSIEQNDGKINGYISVTAENALSAAKAADVSRKNGAAAPLLGVPAAIKDNICTNGVKTTCASKMLENFVPPYDATVMNKLNGQGVPVLGKVNMDEFAMGSSTENSAFKITHNPRGLDRVPGGSSGGSAAVVAANEAPFALGSDTGGSIRQPAAFCGVVGMKPTYGRVSRYGLVAFASSLDQIGPLTKTVEDNAIVLNAIAGYDKKDATSVNREVPDFTSEIGRDVKGMKIALLKQSFGEGLSGEVKSAVLNAARVYEKLGAEIVELSMPSLDKALPAYYVISSAEASSNLARFDGVRYGYRSENYSDITEIYNNSRSEGFGSEVKRRIMLGTFALSSGYYDAYYKKALQ